MLRIKGPLGREGGEIRSRILKPRQSAFGRASEKHLMSRLTRIYEAPAWSCQGLAYYPV